METTEYSKYYIALSPDGQEVALFNSTNLEISTCKFDGLNDMEPFVHKSFQDARKLSTLEHITWSFSISNKLQNGEILIALSCFNKDCHIIPEDKHSRFPTFLRKQSDHSSTNVNDDQLEKGIKEESDSTTWIFSTLNKERIRTAIDYIGGIIKFLSPSEDLFQKQALVIIHNRGITKTTIPLNSHQYNNESLGKSLFSKFGENSYNSNSNNPIEFYFPQSISRKIGSNIENNPSLKYFYENIKKNYFFANDHKENLNIVECYNLGEPDNGELVMSFQDCTNLNVKAIPQHYTLINTIKHMAIEVSRNERLLVHYMENFIVLYLMENSLKVCTKQFTNIQRIIYLQFICNDEKLLIIGERDIEESQFKNSEKSTKVILVIWDLFSSNSEDDSIKITQDSLNLLNTFKHCQLYASSNGNTIYINQDGIINSLLDHPDLIDILETSRNDSLKLHSLYNAQESTLGKNRTINHLDDKSDIDMVEEEAFVNHCEPWKHQNSNSITSISLNNNKFHVIIGNHSIQVWRRKSSRKQKFLEYIWTSKNYQKIEIQSLSIGKNEFLLEFTLQSEENLLYKLHWPHNVLILKDACAALEHLHCYFDDSLIPKNKILFNIFQTQVQNIVKKFIKHQPIIFKLTDIRYDIMSNLIRGNCVSIIKRILFTNVTRSKNFREIIAKENDHLHFPRLYSWDSNSLKKSDLDIAIESACGVNRKDTLIIGYLLDYYSDNAMQNIGWMFTISQAIPHLYDHHLDYYVRELFYKPCFGAKHSHIDRSLISINELGKSKYENLYAINIRQGLLKKSNVAAYNKNSKFKEKSISRHVLKREMTNLCEVPLPDFLVFPRNPRKEINTFVNRSLIGRILKIIFWPRGYVISDDSRSPFLRTLTRDSSITMFSSPSIAALVDYKWRKARWYFLRHYLLYTLFALSFFLITNLIFTDGNWKPVNVTYMKTNIILQAILFYLAYYLLATEFIQLNHQGLKRYINVYNFFDIASVIMPVSLIISIDTYYTSDYTIITSATTLVMWIELLLLLRFFSGPANYINIGLNIIKKVSYFFIFIFILVIAIAHSMYLLLRSPQSINLHPVGQSYAIFNSTSNSEDPNITINETLMLIPLAITIFRIFGNPSWLFIFG